jgi:hypothetical protein
LEQQEWVRNVTTNLLLEHYDEPEAMEITEQIFQERLRKPSQTVAELEMNVMENWLPGRMRKRNRCLETDGTGQMDVGSFVEIGADGDTPALVAEILRVDTVAGRPLVTARVKDLNSNKEPVFTHEGTIRRKGPDARGIYHWVIYHPGAKLLLGIASGTRWFSDKAYGGQEGAILAALRTLDSWKQTCRSELGNLTEPQLCLCPGLDCPNRKVMEIQGRPVRHITTWTLVHATSLEHQLGFATKLGSKLVKERTAVIDARCKRVKGRLTRDETHMSSSLSPSEMDQ